MEDVNNLMWECGKIGTGKGNGGTQNSMTGGLGIA